MTNRSLGVLAAITFAWVAIGGGSVVVAGSPPKKSPTENIQDVIQSADHAARSGDFYEALDLYRQAAEKGDPHAQSRLGIMYLDSDPKEALKWLKLAAAQGYAEAEFTLGWMCQRGIGVPQNKNVATQWYELAAAHRNTEAAFKLGTKVRPEKYDPPTISIPAVTDEQGLLVGLVRAHGYKCDYPMSYRPMYLSHGYVLHCDLWYTYDIKDKGGQWIVTVE
jgi:Sel1 repeat